MGCISGGDKSTVIGILGVFVCEESAGLRQNAYLYPSGQIGSRVFQRLNRFSRRSATN